jgi:hypothetical protein
MMYFLPSGADGKLELLTSDSTAAVAEVRTHAGKDAVPVNVRGSDTPRRSPPQLASSVIRPLPPHLLHGGG